MVVFVGGCGSSAKTATQHPPSTSTSTSTSTTTTTIPPVPAPPTAPPPTASALVKAGTLCTQLGEVGRTITGVRMTCLDHGLTSRKPYNNGRFRWTG